MNPCSAPRETGSQYTDGDSFLGSSYMLDRTGLNLTAIIVFWAMRRLILGMSATWC